MKATGLGPSLIFTERTALDVTPRRTNMQPIQMLRHVSHDQRKGEIEGHVPVFYYYYYYFFFFLIVTMVQCTIRISFCNISGLETLNFPCLSSSNHPQNLGLKGSDAQRLAADRSPWLQDPNCYTPRCSGPLDDPGASNVAASDGRA